MFGKKNGWERANYFESDKPWRRAGEEQREWGGWVKPPYVDTIGRESASVRQHVGLFDLSSFGKIDLQGPGALPLIQRLTDNELNRPLGAVIYTQLLNDQGGIVGDVMITRLGTDHFRVTSGAGFVDSDLGWFRLHRRKEDSSVEIRDVTDEYAVIGLWGPKARNVLETVTTTDVSNDGFPFMTAKLIDVSGISALAQRVTYVGELGWEIYIPVSAAVFVWDRLWAAGKKYQIAACGYKTINSLRLEKGYPALVSDITPMENPYEARLGFCVKIDSSEEFIGRKALLKIRDEGIVQRLCTLIIDGEEYRTLYGGEAVTLRGKVVSRLRSAGYGHTIKKNIGYAYLPLELAEPGTMLEVEIFAESIPAQVSPDILYDPAGEMIKK